MIEKLLARVESRTIPGAPAECWESRLSKLPNGRPRLGVRLGGGRSTSIPAARILVAAREGLPLHGGERWVARHRCDNVACVNPGHLVAGTYSENTADMWERERGARGDRRASAKLSVEKVRQIRSAVASGVSQTQIARAHKVSQSLISQVARRVVWGWVE